MKYKNHNGKQRHVIQTNHLYPETAIIWGAGATVSLGLASTQELGAILSSLIGIGEDLEMTTPLDDRIEKAFDGKIDDDSKEWLKNLLLLLYDGDKSTRPVSAEKVYQDHVKNMLKHYMRYVNKNFSDCINNKMGVKRNLEKNLYELERHYDWCGVRSIAQHIARKLNDGNKKTVIDLMDFLTTVDQLLEMDMAIPTIELFQNTNDKNDSTYLIGKSRLVAVKNCILLLAGTIQRILIQYSLGKGNGKDFLKKIAPYKCMAQGLAELMHEEARGYSGDNKIDGRGFYLFSYGLISFNWDPVLQWIIFQAHEFFNHTTPSYTIDVQGKTYDLRLFNDAGDGIGIRKIFKKVSDVNMNSDLLAFMMNEQACRKVNANAIKNNSEVMRVGKLLFPHGGFGWRACPRCGKLFTDFGETIEGNLTAELFGLDLLPELQPKRRTLTEKEALYITEGDFGAIECVFCGTITKPSDILITVQSAIKSERHYVQDGILRETGLVVGNAKHLVFAGYSLPKDDYVYRCFFQSSMAGQGMEKPLCSFITYDQNYLKYMECNNTPLPVWVYKDGIENYISDMTNRSKDVQQTIRNMLEIFDIDRVRVCFHGIPDIFAHSGFGNQSMEEKLKTILYPSEKEFSNQPSPSSFPPSRR